MFEPGDGFYGCVSQQKKGSAKTGRVLPDPAYKIGSYTSPS